VQGSRLVVVCVRVPVLECDDAIAFVQREWRLLVPVQHREETCADGDGDGHAEGPDHGQPWIFDEHPRAEPGVEPPFVHPRKGARLALPLLGLLDAAKGTPRGEARVLGGHPLREERVFEELQVRVDLAGELGLGAARAHERQQPVEKLPDA
jgi:hypothetical protein